MKFQHLKIGEQFRYQGETYFKSTPLVAHHADTGAQKLIPRYAEIDPLAGTVTSQPPSPAKSLSRSQVRSALEQYHALTLRAAQDILSQAEATSLHVLQDRLNELHTQLLQQLDLLE